jgi:hypothetical protein
LVHEAAFVLHPQPAPLKRPVNRRWASSRLTFITPRKRGQGALPCPAMRLVLPLRQDSHSAVISSTTSYFAEKNFFFWVARHGVRDLDRIAGKSHVHSMRKVHEMAGSRPDWRVSDRCGGIGGRKVIPNPSSHIPSLPNRFHPSPPSPSNSISGTMRPSEI